MTSQPLVAAHKADDFDAIEDAVMETVKGRWFLSEYARRMRNQDQRHILDAIARLDARLNGQPSIETGLESFATQIDVIAAAVRRSYYALREGGRADDVSRDLLCHVHSLASLARMMRAPHIMPEDAHADGENMSGTQAVVAEAQNHVHEEISVTVAPDVASSAPVVEVADAPTLMSTQAPDAALNLAQLDRMDKRQRAALFG